MVFCISMHGPIYIAVWTLLIFSFNNCHWWMYIRSLEVNARKCYALFVIQNSGYLLSCTKCYTCTPPPLMTGMFFGKRFIRYLTIGPVARQKKRQQWSVWFFIVRLHGARPAATKYALSTPMAGAATTTCRFRTWWRGVGQVEYCVLHKDVRDLQIENASEQLILRLIIII